MISEKTLVGAVDYGKPCGSIVDRNVLSDYGNVC